MLFSDTSGGQTRNVAVYNSANKSLDLLRRIIQNGINKDIDAVLKKHLYTYFLPAIGNIRENSSSESVSIKSIQNLCRTVLEEAKNMYTTTSSEDVMEHSDVDLIEGRKPNCETAGKTNECPNSRNGSENILESTCMSSELSRKTTAEKEPNGTVPLIQNRKSVIIHSSDLIIDDQLKSLETLLSSLVKFTLGSAASEALGVRNDFLFSTYPKLFRYKIDQADKDGIVNHKINFVQNPPIGSYIVLLDEVQNLLKNKNWQNNHDDKCNNLIEFTVPQFIINKMLKQHYDDISRTLKQHHDSISKADDSTTSLLDKNETTKSMEIVEKPFLEYLNTKFVESGSKNASNNKCCHNFPFLKEIKELFINKCNDKSEEISIDPASVQNMIIQDEPTVRLKLTSVERHVSTDRIPANKQPNATNTGSIKSTVDLLKSSSVQCEIRNSLDGVDFTLPAQSQECVSEGQALYPRLAINQRFEERLDSSESHSYAAFVISSTAINSTATLSKSSEIIKYNNESLSVSRKGIVNTTGIKESTVDENQHRNSPIQNPPPFHFKQQSKKINLNRFEKDIGTNSSSFSDNELLPSADIKFHATPLKTSNQFQPQTTKNAMMECKTNDSLSDRKYKITDITLQSRTVQNVSNAELYFSHSNKHPMPIKVTQDHENLRVLQLSQNWANLLYQPSNVQESTDPAVQNSTDPRYTVSDHQQQRWIQVFSISVQDYKTCVSKVDDGEKNILPLLSSSDEVSQVGSSEILNLYKKMKERLETMENSDSPLDAIKMDILTDQKSGVLNAQIRHPAVAGNTSSDQRIVEYRLPKSTRINQKSTPRSRNDSVPSHKKSEKANKHQPGTTGGVRKAAVVKNVLGQQCIAVDENVHKCNIQFCSGSSELFHQQIPSPGTQVPVANRRRQLDNSSTVTSSKHHHVSRMTSSKFGQPFLTDQFKQSSDSGIKKPYRIHSRLQNYQLSSRKEEKLSQNSPSISRKVKRTSSTDLSQDFNNVKANVTGINSKAFQQTIKSEKEMETETKPTKSELLEQYTSIYQQLHHPIQSITESWKKSNSRRITISSKGVQNDNHQPPSISVKSTQKCSDFTSSIHNQGIKTGQKRKISELPSHSGLLPKSATHNQLLDQVQLLSKKPRLLNQEARTRPLPGLHKIKLCESGIIQVIPYAIPRSPVSITSGSILSPTVENVQQVINQSGIDIKYVGKFH